MSAFYYNLIAQGVPPHMAAKASGYSNGQIRAPYISTAKPANTWTQGDGYYPGKASGSVGVGAGTPTSRAYSLAHPWPSG